jgi:hypothetical protein
MRPRYVRFVTAVIDPNSLRRQGLFQAVSELVEWGELREHELAEVEALRFWFNARLDRPARFARSRRSGATPRAICWFKSSAREHVRRMHEMRRLVEEHGVATEMIKTARPGYVVFEDEFQVAAEPFWETRT